MFSRSKWFGDASPAHSRAYEEPLLSRKVFIKGSCAKFLGQIELFINPSPKEAYKGSVEWGARLKVFIQNNESPPGVAVAELARNRLEDRLS